MPMVPTQEDLEQLPYFAILALGAHCARQVVPLFQTWERAPRQHVQALSGAIQAVETLAGCPEPEARTPLWVSAADATLLAADAASAADRADAPPTALCAADAAAELSAAIDPAGPRTVAARAVRKTVRASAAALDQSEAGGKSAFLGQVTGIVERLRQHAAAEGWTDETGVRITDS